MVKISALHPINPSSVSHEETEKKAPWVVRKLAGSLTGRIVMSGYESLRATGTSVICLSPWGDSSPLLLPCIRFRDLAVHLIIASTGGTAAIAAPIMAPLGDTLLTTMGDSIIVELTLDASFKLAVEGANEVFIDHPIDRILPENDKRLKTTQVKEMVITLKYKHRIEDAALGFFKSSVGARGAPSLFGKVVDYIAIEKGWFSPYLFASGRRPIIPRSMTPDVIFCHGPFLGGDYRIGQTLLKESATIIALCRPPAPMLPPRPGPSPTLIENSRSGLNIPSFSEMVDATKAKFSRSRPSSPAPPLGPPLSPRPSSSSSTPTLTPCPPSSSQASTQSPHLDSPPPPYDTLSSHPPSANLPELLPQPSRTLLTPTSLEEQVIPIAPPRRLVLVVLGLKPHRRLWTTSARPSESVLQYLLLDGCPAIVLPIKPGCPLIAWHAITLKELHRIEDLKSKKAEGVIDVLEEYLGLCVDWERVLSRESKEVESNPSKSSDVGRNIEGSMKKMEIGEDQDDYDEQMEVEDVKDINATEVKKKAVREAVKLIVIGAINSKESKEVKKEVDLERAGIVMFRIP